MTTIKEIRCETKKGAERFIPEKLTKDPVYMKQMGLTIADPTVEQKEYFARKAKEAKPEEPEEIEELESEENKEEKENTIKPKKKKNGDQGSI